MKFQLNLKKAYWLLFAAISVIAYNNCGEGFVAQQLSSSLGGGSVFSRSPGETCEDAILKVYRSTYHPFLVQNCNSCHITGGGGSGVFAEKDANVSYASFVSKGASLINSQSVGAHKPPYTGPQNQARIDELNLYWGQAQTEYVNCVSQSANPPPGMGGAFVVKTSSRAVPGNLATTFVRLEWDLETQSAAKVPLIAGIEIRRSVMSNVTQGYEFRNPTLRLKGSASSSYEARALNLFINNALQGNVTTYSNIEAVISGTSDVNLAPGFANAFAFFSPASTDVIALEFSSLKSTTGAPNPGGGATPTPTPAPTATPIGNVTYASLIGNGGVFANSCVSCHRSGNASGGLDLTNYAAARDAAQIIKSRVNNANNPMPTGGLLPAAQRDRISAWVDQGTPQ